MAPGCKSAGPIKADSSCRYLRLPSALVTPLLNGDHLNYCPSIWSTLKAVHLLSQRGGRVEVTEVIVESFLDIHEGLT